MLILLTLTSLLSSDNNKPDLGSSNYAENYKFYIDDKEVTKEEAENLPNDQILTMKIKKEGNECIVYIIKKQAEG